MMTHQDVSVMRALSTKTALTTGQAVQSAGRCAERNKQERIGVEHCHNLNLGNCGQIIYLLLHSWDFHDVLYRLDSRMINRLH